MVGRRNAVAVVLHLNRVQSAVLKPHICRMVRLKNIPQIRARLAYRSGTGIQAILDQLFDNGAEVDDNLSRLDLVYLEKRRSVGALEMHCDARGSQSGLRWP